jgi:hypothetical protein
VERRGATLGGQWHARRGQGQVGIRSGGGHWRRAQRRCGARRPVTRRCRSARGVVGMEAGSWVWIRTRSTPGGGGAWPRQERRVAGAPNDGAAETTGVWARACGSASRDAR